MVMHEPLLHPPGRRCPATRAIVVFFVLLALLCAGVAIAVRHGNEDERNAMERIIMVKTLRISEIVSRLLHKTQALNALVVLNNGSVAGFERVAEALMDDPAILNLILAPDGVVSKVYPLEGNEVLIGYNLLGAGPGNKEAVLAKQKGQLVFGGPFPLMQGGGLALVGRLPVWLETPKGRRFWGLVSVTLKYPEALAGAELEELSEQGLAFEIWRINADDNTRQVIAGTDYIQKPGMRFIEKHISLFNADWYFRIFPIVEWYKIPSYWYLTIAGFCICLLSAFIVHRNSKLRKVQAELQYLARTDSLTGLLNRTGFWLEALPLAMQQKPMYVFYIDLNYFKRINDVYGHNAGDQALRVFSQRVKARLPSSAVFARLGGDEFIILLPAENWKAADVERFWLLAARDFEEPLCTEDGELFFLSFSRGTALYPKDGNTLERAITRADKNMFEQKNERYSRERKRRADDAFISPSRRKAPGTAIRGDTMSATQYPRVFSAE